MNNTLEQKRKSLLDKVIIKNSKEHIEFNYDKPKLLKTEMFDDRVEQTYFAEVSHGSMLPSNDSPYFYSWSKGFSLQNTDALPQLEKEASTQRFPKIWKEVYRPIDGKIQFSEIVEGEYKPSVFASYQFP